MRFQVRKHHLPRSFWASTNCRSRLPLTSLSRSTSIFNSAAIKQKKPIEFDKWIIWIYNIIYIILLNSLTTVLSNYYIYRIRVVPIRHRCSTVYHHHNNNNNNNNNIYIYIYTNCNTHCAHTYICTHCVHIPT